MTATPLTKTSSPDFGGGTTVSSSSTSAVAASTPQKQQQQQTTTTATAATMSRSSSSCCSCFPSSIATCYEKTRTFYRRVSDKVFGKRQFVPSPYIDWRTESLRYSAWRLRFESPAVQQELYRFLGANRFDLYAALISFFGLANLVRTQYVHANSFFVPISLLTLAITPFYLLVCIWLQRRLEASPLAASSSSARESSSSHRSSSPKYVYDKWPALFPRWMRRFSPGHFRQLMKQYVAVPCIVLTVSFVAGFGGAYVAVPCYDLSVISPPIYCIDNCSTTSDIFISFHRHHHQDQDRRSDPDEEDRNNGSDDNIGSSGVGVGGESESIGEIEEEWLEIYHSIIFFATTSSSSHDTATTMMDHQREVEEVEEEGHCTLRFPSSSVVETIISGGGAVVNASTTTTPNASSTARFSPAEELLPISTRGKKYTPTGKVLRVGHGEFAKCYMANNETRAWDVVACPALSEECTAGMMASPTGGRHIINHDRLRYGSCLTEIRQIPVAMFAFFSITFQLSSAVTMFYGAATLLTIYLGRLMPVRADLNLPRMCDAWQDQPLQFLFVEMVCYLVAFAFSHLVQTLSMRSLLEQFVHTLRMEARLRELSHAYSQLDALLGVLFPADVLNRILGSETVYDSAAEATVLLARLDKFDTWCRGRPVRDIVPMVHTVFTVFDRLLPEASNDIVIKLRTEGDTYRLACGIPQRVTKHAEIMCCVARRMVEALREANEAFPEWGGVGLRVGIHSGQLEGAILGIHTMEYSVFGVTVDTAELCLQQAECTMIEARGGHIVMTEAVAEQLSVTCSEEVTYDESSGMWQSVAGVKRCTPLATVHTTPSMGAMGPIIRFYTLPVTDNEDEDVEQEGGHMGRLHWKMPEYAAADIITSHYHPHDDLDFRPQTPLTRQPISEAVRLADLFKEVEMDRSQIFDHSFATDMTDADSPVAPQKKKKKARVVMLDGLNGDDGVGGYDSSRPSSAASSRPSSAASSVSSGGSSRPGSRGSIGSTRRVGIRSKKKAEEERLILRRSRQTAELIRWAMESISRMAKSFEEARQGSSGNNNLNTSTTSLDKSSLSLTPTPSLAPPPPPRPRQHLQGMKGRFQLGGLGGRSGGINALSTLGSPVSSGTTGPSAGVSSFSSPTAAVEKSGGNISPQQPIITTTSPATPSSASAARGNSVSFVFPSSTTTKSAVAGAAAPAQESASSPAQQNPLLSPPACSSSVGAPAATATVLEAQPGANTTEKKDVQVLNLDVHPSVGVAVGTSANQREDVDDSRMLLPAVEADDADDHLDREGGELPEVVVEGAMKESRSAILGGAALVFVFMLIVSAVSGTIGGAYFYVQTPGYILLCMASALAGCALFISLLLLTRRNNHTNNYNNQSIISTEEDSSSGVMSSTVSGGGTSDDGVGMTTAVSVAGYDGDGGVGTAASGYFFRLDMMNAANTVSHALQQAAFTCIIAVSMFSGCSIPMSQPGWLILMQCVLPLTDPITIPVWKQVLFYIPSGLLIILHSAIAPDTLWTPWEAGFIALLELLFVFQSRSERRSNFITSFVDRHRTDYYVQMRQDQTEFFQELLGAVLPGFFAATYISAIEPAKAVTEGGGNGNNKEGSRRNSKQQLQLQQQQLVPLSLIPPPCPQITGRLCVGVFSYRLPTNVDPSLGHLVNERIDRVLKRYSTNTFGGSLAKVFRTQYYQQHCDQCESASHCCYRSPHCGTPVRENTIVFAADFPSSSSCSPSVGSSNSMVVASSSTSNMSRSSSVTAISSNDPRKKKKQNEDDSSDDEVLPSASKVEVGSIKKKDDISSARTSPRQTQQSSQSSPQTNNNTAASTLNTSATVAAMTTAGPSSSTNNVPLSMIQVAHNLGWIIDGVTRRGGLLARGGGSDASRHQGSNTNNKNNNKSSKFSKLNSRSRRSSSSTMVVEEDDEDDLSFSDMTSNCSTSSNGSRTSSTNPNHSSRGVKSSEEHEDEQKQQQQLKHHRCGLHFGEVAVAAVGSRRSFNIYGQAVAVCEQLMGAREAAAIITSSSPSSSSQKNKNINGSVDGSDGTTSTHTMNTNHDNRLHQQQQHFSTQEQQKQAVKEEAIFMPRSSCHHHHHSSGGGGGKAAESVRATITEEEEAMDKKIEDMDVKCHAQTSRWDEEICVSEEFYRFYKMTQNRIAAAAAKSAAAINNAPTATARRIGAVLGIPSASASSSASASGGGGSAAFDDPGISLQNTTTKRGNNKKTEGSKRSKSTSVADSASASADSAAAADGGGVQQKNIKGVYLNMSRGGDTETDTGYSCCTTDDDERHSNISRTHRQQISSISSSSALSSSTHHNNTHNSNNEQEGLSEQSQQEAATSTATATKKGQEQEQEGQQKKKTRRKMPLHKRPSTAAKSGASKSSSSSTASSVAIRQRVEFRRPVALNAWFPKASSSLPDDAEGNENDINSDFFSEEEEEESSGSSSSPNNTGGEEVGNTSSSGGSTSSSSLRRRTTNVKKEEKTKAVVSSSSENNNKCDDENMLAEERESDATTATSAATTLMKNKKRTTTLEEIESLSHQQHPLYRRLTHRRVYFVDVE